MPDTVTRIQSADNEFYIAGSGIITTFKNRALTVGILKNEEGYFENDKLNV